MMESPRRRWELLSLLGVLSSVLSWLGLSNPVLSCPVLSGSVLVWVGNCRRCLPLSPRSRTMAALLVQLLMTTEQAGSRQS